jgi:hypothetical protein
MIHRVSILDRARRHAHPALLLDLVGLALFVLALDATLQHLGKYVDALDEGNVLTNAKLLGWQFVPYRDFYAPYPPGIFVTLATLWKLCGVSVCAERCLSFGVHLLIALGAGRAAARLAGRRFSVLTAALVLAFLVRERLTLYAWLAAVGVLFVFCELAAHSLALRSAPRAAAAGVTLALVSFYRHDLFVYFAVTLALGVAVGVFATRSPPPLRWHWLVGAAAATLVVLWLPVFARAGVRQVVNDLYFDQVRWVLPARRLAFPPLFVVRHHALSTLLGQPRQFALVLTLLGPFLALPRVLRSDQQWRWDALPLLAATLAVIPQSLGRPDMWHVLGTVPPSLAAMGALVERMAAAPRGWLWRAPLVTLLLAFLIWPVAAVVGDLRPVPPLVDPALSPERQQLVKFVQKHTAPREPIYNGYRQHQRLCASEVDLYYFCDRPGATRYMLFEPNIITRADVQRRMIEEIEQKHVRLAILLTESDPYSEPNESSRSGSDVLDQYLRKTFRPVARFGRYEVYWRKRRDDSSGVKL